NDIRAALGRDHEIGTVLQHRQMVADADTERAAGAALADNDTQDRRGQPRHHRQILRDRLGDAALLTVDTGIGAGRIDQRDDRQFETLRRLHQTQRLAVALRLRHAEIAFYLFLHAAAFLLRDHHDWFAVEPRHSTDDGLVVAEMAIAVQLIE